MRLAATWPASGRVDGHPVKACGRLIQRKEGFRQYIRQPENRLCRVLIFSKRVSSMNRHISIWRRISGRITGTSPASPTGFVGDRWTGSIRYLLCLLCLPLAVVAQQDQEAASPPSSAETQPEEMVIRGGSSVQRIRARMLAAERQLYDLFNQLNDEDRFNVSCSSHQPTGTRFREQVCLPRFVRDATSAHGRHYWETYRAFLDPYTPAEGVYYTHEPMQTTIASQQEAFQDKMREVARNNPEFVEALAQHSRFVEQYEAATGRDESQQ